MATACQRSHSGGPSAYTCASASASERFCVVHLFCMRAQACVHACNCLSFEGELNALSSSLITDCDRHRRNMMKSLGGRRGAATIARLKSLDSTTVRLTMADGKAAVKRVGLPAAAPPRPSQGPSGSPSRQPSRKAQQMPPKGRRVRL